MRQRLTMNERVLRKSKEAKVVISPKFGKAALVRRSDCVCRGK